MKMKYAIHLYSYILLVGFSIIELTFIFILYLIYVIFI